MPKIFDAPANIAPSGGGGRRASEGDVGGFGRGMVEFGGAISDISDILKVREDKRSITSARAQFSEFEIEFRNEEAERQRLAPVGAPGHYDESQKLFDDKVGDFTSKLNNVQKYALGERIATARTSYLDGARIFQAESTVNAEIIDVGNIKKALDGDLFIGGTDVKTAMEEYGLILNATTFSAQRKNKALDDALPEFQAQVLAGLLERPADAIRMLESGELSDFNPEALAKFEGEAVAAVLGLGKKAKERRYASELGNNAAAFDLIKQGGSLADLGKVPGLSDEVRNAMRRALIKQNTPVRSQDEKLDASARTMAEYTDLGIALKKGKYESSAILEKLLSFQTRIIGLGMEGFLSSSEVARYNRNIEEIVQGSVGHTDTGTFGLPFGDIIRDNPFNIGNEKLIDHVKKYNLTRAQHAELARRFNDLLDENKIDPNINKVDGYKESRDALVLRLVDQTITDYVHMTVPATQGMPKVPNHIIGKGGHKPGAPGESNLESDVKVDDDVTIGYDKNTGQYWRVKKDKNGDFIEADPITPDQANGITIEERQRLDEEAERLEKDESQSEELEKYYRSLTLQGSEDANPDIDPDPLRSLTPLPPAPPRPEEAGAPTPSVDESQVGIRYGTPAPLNPVKIEPLPDADTNPDNVEPAGLNKGKGALALAEVVAGNIREAVDSVGKMLDATGESIKNISLVGSANAAELPANAATLPLQQRFQNIDWSIIAKEEGGNHIKAYTLDSGQFNVDDENYLDDTFILQFSKSGVTVGIGVDLGQYNEGDLKGLSDKKILDKLKPYLGLKGQDAIDFLKKNPLELTEPEAVELNKFIKTKILTKLEKDWNASGSKIPFDRLSTEQATAVASVAFQYGNSKAAYSNFWKYATNGEWDKVYDELMDFKDKDKSINERHKRSARYILGRQNQLLSGATPPRSPQQKARWRGKSKELLSGATPPPRPGNS